jgi:hypothetical protein
MYSKPVKFKTRKTILLLGLFFLLNPLSGSASDKFTFSGYLKELAILNFNDFFRFLEFDNILKDRTNLRWYPNEKLTFASGTRLRLFFGETVRSFEDFSEELEAQEQKEFIDLSWTIFETNTTLLFLNFDRLWVDYFSNPIQIRQYLFIHCRL